MCFSHSKCPISYGLNLFVQYEDVSVLTILPKGPSDWFKKELNAQ